MKVSGSMLPAGFVLVAAESAVMIAIAFREVFTEPGMSLDVSLAQRSLVLLVQRTEIQMRTARFHAALVRMP